LLRQAMAELPEGTAKSRLNRGRTELVRQVQRIREEDEGVTG
jgi:DNA-directed RNA polymerase specialized sigma24 family protein